MPKEKQRDLDFIVEQLDWDKNVDPRFKQHNYVEPIVDPACSGPGYTDRWIDYGHFNGEQLVSAKELTLMPGAKCLLKDPGRAVGSPCRAAGESASLRCKLPVMIHFGEEPWDEVFITAEAARAGVEIENTGGEPLVGLRYFGPDVHRTAGNRRPLQAMNVRPSEENPSWTIRTQLSETAQCRLAGAGGQGRRGRAAHRAGHRCSI